MVIWARLAIFFSIFSGLFLARNVFGDAQNQHLVKGSLVRIVSGQRVAKNWVNPERSGKAKFVGQGNIVCPSVVTNSKSKAVGDDECGIGFLAFDGVIVTNYHVAGGLEVVQISFPQVGKKTFKAKVLGSWPEKDLTFVELDCKAKSYLEKKHLATDIVPLTKFERVNCSTHHYFGFPKGDDKLFSASGKTLGHMAGRFCPVYGNSFLTPISTAKTKPGFSGSPVVSDDGGLVGVHFQGLFAGSRSLDIPAKVFESRVQELKSGKQIRDIFFGWAEWKLVEFEPNAFGCKITKIIDSASAYGLGFSADDIIVAVDGMKVAPCKEKATAYGFDGIQATLEGSTEKMFFTEHFDSLAPGKVSTLTILRGNKLVTHKICVDALRSVRPVIDYQFVQATDELEYKQLGGMTLMDLTLNHLNSGEKVFQHCPSYKDFCHANPGLVRLAREHAFSGLVLVTDVAPKTWAKKNGVRPGMALKTIGGQRISGLYDLEGIDSLEGLEVSFY